MMMVVAFIFDIVLYSSCSDKIRKMHKQQTITTYIRWSMIQVTCVLVMRITAEEEEEEEEWEGRRTRLSLKEEEGQEGDDEKEENGFTRE